MRFKYLWVAELTDGSFIKQNRSDQSTLDPKRNCYYDLLQILQNENKKIRRFSLVGEGNTLTVDLGNGIFYINGLALLIESDRLPTLPDRFELIWYNQVTRDLKVIYDLKTKKTLKSEDQGGEFREFFIGWECVIAGKRYQQKIAIS